MTGRPVPNMASGPGRSCGSSGSGTARRTDEANRPSPHGSRRLRLCRRQPGRRRHGGGRCFPALSVERDSCRRSHLHDAGRCRQFRMPAIFGVVGRRSDGGGHPLQKGRRRLHDIPLGSGLRRRMTVRWRRIGHDAGAIQTPFADLLLDAHEYAGAFLFDTVQLDIEPAQSFSGDLELIRAATVAALEERGRTASWAHEGGRRSGCWGTRGRSCRCSSIVRAARRNCSRRRAAEDGARYIACRNEAENARAGRLVAMGGLQRCLADGGKALIGNRAYRIPALHGRGQGVRDRRRQARRGGPLRRHLRSAHQRPHGAAQRPAPPPEAAHGGRPVQTGEDPVAHPPDLPSCDAAIRSHVFCSFLALALQRNWATAAARPASPSIGTT